MAASRSRLGVIFLTVLIDLIGFGIIMPILPLYAQRFGAQGLGYGALVFVFSAMQFVSASVILRESLAAEHRRERPLFDLGHMSEALRRERLRPLMLVWFLAPFSFAGYTVALPLHATQALSWGAKELGWLFVVIGVIAAAVQGFLFGRLERHTGARALLIVGLFGMAASIAAVPYAMNSLQLYILTVPLAFANSLFAPAASGLVSIYAVPTEQGTSLAAAQAFAARRRSVGPLGAGWAYDGLGQRTVFMLAGAIMVGAGVSSVQLQEMQRLDAQTHRGEPLE